VGFNPMLLCLGESSLLSKDNANKLCLSGDAWFVFARWAIMQNSWLIKQ